MVRFNVFFFSLPKCGRAEKSLGPFQGGKGKGAPSPVMESRRLNESPGNGWIGMNIGDHAILPSFMDKNHAKKNRSLYTPLKFCLCLVGDFFKESTMINYHF